METFSDVTVNVFPELTFIAGSYKELTFYLNSPSGSPIDVQYMNALWELSPYNISGYVSASKTAICSDGYCTVYLLSTDTDNLSGKYTQRLSITGVIGYENRIGQGSVNIIPRIGIDNYE